MRNNGEKSLSSEEGQSEHTEGIRKIDEIPTRLFAIGDLHGCADELRSLLTYLKTTLSLGSSDLVIFIGDYIDRGLKSKDVIDLLVDFKEQFPSTVFLRGNHEDMFLSFLGLGGESGDSFLPNGGEQTLESYGIPKETPALAVLSLLPEKHRRFFTTLEVGVSVAEFLFVHAGVRPGRPLEEQEVHDLMWIRGDFTGHIHELGKTVVFGHTPFEDVLIHLPYKIGIDTGLVYGNLLSCVELVEGDLYQVDFGESRVKVASLRHRFGSTT